MPTQPTPPPDKPQSPFNEVSILFPLLTLYTAGYLALTAAEFFLRGAFKTPAGMMPVYIGLLSAYAADKEIRRWAGAPEPPRKGSLFVYLWLLFFLGAFVLQAFRPEFRLPDELGKVVLQVLGIFFGSRASKYMYEKQNRPLDPTVLTAREEQALALIRARGQVVNRDVAEALAISRDAAKRVLSDLARKGLIRLVGERKASHYVLTEPPPSDDSSLSTG